jgi:hypothetical protein
MVTSPRDLTPKIPKVDHPPLPALLSDLTASGFTVTTLPLTTLGRCEDGSPQYRLVLAPRANTP